MGNLASKTFTGLGSFTWTAPAGVTQVNVVATVPPPQIQAPSANPCFYPQDSLGNIYGVGYNNGGELGDNTVVNKSSPVLMLGGLNVKSIVVQQGNSNANPYILTTNGTAYAAGNNNSGQLGDGTSTNRSSPVAVVGGLNFVQIAVAEGRSVLGLTANGTLYAWGLNTNGQLGDGTVTSRSSPVKVLGGLTFSQIYTWGSSSYGLTSSGAMYGWGLNSNGRLGVGDTTPRSSPVAVLGGLTFAKFPVKMPSYEDNGAPQAMGMFGITTSGALYGWGVNGFGQLGLGDSNDRSSPVAVVGGLTVGSVYPTITSTFAINTAGAAYSWGDNSNGALGVNVSPGTTAAFSSPVAVVGGLTFASISATNNSTPASTMGVTTSGVAYGWGINTQGQLGTNDRTVRSSPTAVVGGLTFAQVVLCGSSPYNAVGMTTNGVYWTWGNGPTTGQLGDGTITSKSSPVLVLGGVAGIGSLSQNISTKLTVLPGTSYTVNVGGYSATFGNTIVGSNFPTSITVYFEE